MNVIELENVQKIYSMGDEKVYALKGISFSVEQGEFISIMGPSGSGKSTCMNMIGCLDTPTSGIVRIDGMETLKMKEKALAELRNRTIGFVFQQYHLIPSMTVLENVMLPLKYKRLADEPTGALDTKTGEQVMTLFRETNKSGTTVIIVTHDARIGNSTERCIKILDGLLC